ncbi:hypothetical protein [Streptomyces sp. NPDC006610]|jgi:hypothetical protein|uniref:hypothetical protein n=1 Tax=Streptomyces sp. NPDC006610 TaxID=3154584 RepID=UPI00339F016F
MSNPGLMVGRDVRSLAQAAAQDTDACSALQWLVETGRIHPDAHILHLEVRTWRPR